MNAQEPIVDLAYGAHHPRQRLNAMLPAGDRPFPVVIGIHGGAWRIGDKQEMHPLARILAEMGIASVMPNYRFSTSNPHPAQEEDIFSALDWVHQNAPTYGFDLQRVGLTGHSAGGHLAALVGLKATQRPRPYRVQCMMPFGGIYDFEAWLRDVPISRDEVESLLGGSAERQATTIQAMSPISHVHANAPVCLVVNGEMDDEVPVNQTMAFVEALTAVGAAATAKIIPGCGHALMYRQAHGTLEPLGGRTLFEDFFRTNLLAGQTQL